MLQSEFQCVSRSLCRCLALRKCSEVLGAGDRKRWEDIIFSFIQSGQLKVLERWGKLSCAVEYTAMAIGLCFSWCFMQKHLISLLGS